MRGPAGTGALLALALLCAAAPAAGGAASDGQAAAGEAATVAVEPSPEDYVRGSWELYRSRFVDDEGRIVDDDNGMISHSEGQGYGMLIAVAADDRASFERIWGWTKRELFIRGDPLAAWRWDPAADPHVTDTNNATDGDLLIAWALLRASERWGARDHKREARGIVDAIADLAVADSAFGRVLVPGTAGFDAEAQPDGPVVNLSYWVMPAIAELQVISPKLAEARLLESGKRLIAASEFGPARLPSDWIGLGGPAPRPAQNFPAQYGYNAVRIPLYLAWYSRDDIDAMTRFAEAWTQGGLFVPGVVDLGSGTIIEGMDAPGYHALGDLLSCALHRTEVARTARAFEPTTYYPSTLHVLSLMALSERYPQCL